MIRRGLYYEDLIINEKIKSTGRTITEADLVLFATLTGDMNPIHCDEEYSKVHSIYGKRVVHGLLIHSIAEGLMYRMGLFDGVEAVSMAWNNVKFKKPVFIGDTIYLELTIKNKRESKSRVGFGVVTMFYEVVNQKGETVMEAEHVLLVPMKEKKPVKSEK